MVISILFELLMLGAYVWQGLSQGEWDAQLVWLGHACALVCLVVWALLGMRRIQVDGEALTARTALGTRRKTTFAQIDRAETDYQMMSLTLFVEGAAFAKVGLWHTCIANLLERLADEGIDVSEAAKGPMTKGKLCWAAMRPVVMAFLGIDVAASSILAFMCVFAGADPSILALVPFLFLLVGIILPTLLLSMPLRGIWVLGRQERKLGFSFSSEMEARGATGTSFEDGDWFVGLGNTRIVAFRRDYIDRISSVEGSDSGDRCLLVSKDGKRHKVYASKEVLEDLRRWFRKGPRGVTGEAPRA